MNWMIRKHFTLILLAKNAFIFRRGRRQSNYLLSGSRLFKWFLRAMTKGKL